MTTLFKLLAGGGKAFVNFIQLLAPLAFLWTAEATFLFIFGCNIG
jgi:hypothetical protein